jgi:hypothetical protein
MVALGLTGKPSDISAQVQPFLDFSDFAAFVKRKILTFVGKEV